MKTINAVWEKRNLGIDVTEVSVETSDKAGDLREVLHNIDVPYSVVKIPSNRPELLATAQECGFRTVEMGIELVGNMRSIKMPEIYNRFSQHIRTEQATGTLLESVLEEIRRGEIFNTDRIVQDPVFSTEAAGKRYYNWCCDALNSGAYLGVILYKDTPVAFNIAKEIAGQKGVMDGILGGVLPQAANKGLGFLVVQCEIDICKQYEASQYIAKASSNNLPILRLHLQSGYELKSMSYVLIKHQ